MSGATIMTAFGEARRELFDHVGLIPGWVLYPIEDLTEMFWYIDRDGIVPHVYYAPTMDELNSAQGNFYGPMVFDSSYYPQSVYEGAELTMIIIDPQTDGMDWFGVFLNERRVLSVPWEDMDR